MSTQIKFSFEIRPLAIEPGEVDPADVGKARVELSGVMDTKDALALANFLERIGQKYGATQIKEIIHEGDEGSKGSDSNAPSEGGQR